METTELRDEIIPVYQQLFRALERGQERTFHTVFDDLHNYDQAQIFQALSAQQRRQLIEWVDPVNLADVFDLIDPETIDEQEYLSEMTPQYAAKLLNAMYVDNAVDLLGIMPDVQRQRYLQQLAPEDAKEMRELLGYADQTAGSLMSTEYVAVDLNLTIGEALVEVKRQASESEQIIYIYVLDHEKLAGVISLKSLIIHADDEQVVDVMTQNLVTALPNEDQENVARLMADYDLVALPVVSQDDQMLGIIMIDDILDVIEAESAEDYERFAGVHNVDFEESPFQSVVKRLPWLLILVFLGLGTASVIKHYDLVVQQLPLLAVFITLITGTAGNAGTQSLAVAIRRITLHEHPGVWRMIGVEVLIGLLMGLLAGSTIFLVVWLWTKIWLFGLAVGLAMACAITVANLAGTVVPWLMSKVKIDPAVASGPFISTLSDLTSVVIYFNIAEWLLGLHF